MAPDIQSANPEFKKNLRFLYLDILGFGLLAGSTLAFIGVYAARLGAGAFELSLLNAAPAIVSLVLALPCGGWLHGRPLSPVVFWTSLLNRQVYIWFIPLAAWFTPSQQVSALVWLLVLASVPGVMLGIAFNAMYADTVPPEWRPHVVARRTAVYSVTLTLTSLWSGGVLHRWPFPQGYQIIFGLGLLGATLSSLALYHVRPPRIHPPRVQRPIGDPARGGVFGRRALGLPSPIMQRFLTRGEGKGIFRLDLIRGAYGGFLSAYFFYVLAQVVPGPLFPLYWVDELALSDNDIGIGNSLFFASVFVVSLVYARLAHGVGNRRIATVGTALTALYPLLTALAGNTPMFIASRVVGGMTWGLADAAILSYSMDRVPDHDRPAHMALNNLALNLASLGGAMLAPALQGSVGLREALLVAALLRFASGLMLGWKG